MRTELTEQPHFYNGKEVPKTYCIYLEANETANCNICDRGLIGKDAWFISYDQPYIPKKRVGSFAIENRKIRVFSCIDHERQGNNDRKDDTKIPLIMDKYQGHLCLFVRIVKE